NTNSPPAIAWWRFDEGAGNVTADVSGNGHMGTLVNSPVWQQGIRGFAVALDGSSQYVMVSNGPIIGSTPNFTIEAWVNWQGGPGIQTIYSEGGGLSDAIDLHLDTGTPEFATYNGSGFSSARSFRTIPQASWHHLAALLGGA